MRRIEDVSDGIKMDSRENEATVSTCSCLMENLLKVELNIVRPLTVVFSKLAVEAFLTNNFHRRTCQLTC